MATQAYRPDGSDFDEATFSDVHLDTESSPFLPLEESKVASASRPRASRRYCLAILRIAFFIILSAGWVLYLVSRFHAPIIPSYARPPNTPLPSEVFEVRKKTFFRDQRYIGYSDESNRNWNHLVAGK
jgi:hypothetical protein